MTHGLFAYFNEPLFLQAYACTSACVLAWVILCASSMLNLPSGFAKVLQICVSDWHAAAQPLLNGQCQSVYQSDMSSDNPAFSLTGLELLVV